MINNVREIKQDFDVNICVRLFIKLRKVESSHFRVSLA